MLVRYDGHYEGRIIDADTGQPIEGVVVLGVWYREYPGAGGAVHEYYDARETVTDQNGEFKIEGLGLLVMSNIIPMDVLIFKAGHTHYGLMTWKGLKGLYRLKETRRLFL
jgi:protocatechuate 3,4-dioxygenase beta subunit